MSFKRPEAASWVENQVAKGAAQAWSPLLHWVLFAQANKYGWSQHDTSQEQTLPLYRKRLAGNVKL